MQIKFIDNEKGLPAGKLADAELHFDDGEPLAGLKLIGFGVWERRDGGRNVTFPARQYSVNGERRSFALLRPGVAEASSALTELILGEYDKHARLTNASEADLRAIRASLGGLRL